MLICKKHSRMLCIMKELIWSNGNKPERSSRSEYLKSKTQTQTQTTTQTKTQTLDNKEIDYEKEAVMTALEMGDPLSGFRASSSRRDDVNTKMGERQLIGRVCHNPFLTEDTYINDITIEDNLLRPRNTKD